MTIISSDTEAGFNFTFSSDLLLIKEGVTMAVEQDYAIEDGNLVAGSTLINKGAIYSNFAAVVLRGDYSTVINEASGSIVGAEGVYFGGEIARLDNSGYIYGALDGVNIDGGSGYIANSGTVSSPRYGITLTTSLTVEIHNTGVVRGGNYSIVTPFNGGGGPLNVLNDGALIGDVFLVNCSVCTVRNSGVIQGYVLLSSGDDGFDGRGGTVSGFVGGYEGNDTLRGGHGEDQLIGGEGADRLNGGRGDDVFSYGFITESKGKDIDVIRGWDEGDVLDLSSLDANPRQSGIQHLSFGGQIAPGDPVGNDQVQYYRQNGDTYVVADINGDGKADLTIKIAGLVTLDAGDFILS
ncbi:MAG TPA: M10 family metallopeptidase C-terminal domain-containing protein [Caulobacteraceae bacterium]|jgi:hypothetical protein